MAWAETGDAEDCQYLIPNLLKDRRTTVVGGGGGGGGGGRRRGGGGGGGAATAAPSPVPWKVTVRPVHFRHW
ncbi:glycine-rich domain-containing protein, partial [Streptomyces iakyrus]